MWRRCDAHWYLKCKERGGGEERRGGATKIFGVQYNRGRLSPCIITRRALITCKSQMCERIWRPCQQSNKHKQRPSFSQMQSRRLSAINLIITISKNTPRTSYEPTSTTTPTTNTSRTRISCFYRGRRHWTFICEEVQQWNYNPSNLQFCKETKSVQLFSVACAFEFKCEYN